MTKKILNIIFLSILSITVLSCAKKEVEVDGEKYDVSSTYKVAISQTADKKTLDSMRKGFVTEMKKLGYLEDVNITYRYENASGNKSYAEQIADVYKDDDADIIVTIGDISTMAMTEKVSDKPIVFIGVGNAERLGLTDSEGTPLLPNVTGVVDSHLIAERLKYINLNYPDVKKIGIIYVADNSLAKYDVDYFKFNATAYDIDIYTASITKPDQINDALNEIIPKVDAIALVTDYVVDDKVGDIIKRADSEGILVFGDTDEHLAAGAIVTTGRDYQLVGEYGAKLVNSILKDEKTTKELKIETVNFRIS